MQEEKIFLGVATLITSPPSPPVDTYASVTPPTKFKILFKKAHARRHVILASSVNPLER
jgi:hypothetical protein